MDGMDLTCGHFVNPFTDIGFKIIFGQPASKEFDYVSGKNATDMALVIVSANRYNTPANKILYSSV